MTDFEAKAGLEKTRANYVPLSPLSFLARSRDVFGDLPAVVYGNRQYNWRQVADRSVRLATALTALGYGKGDVVSVLAANTPEMVEAHFGVPMPQEGNLCRLAYISRKYHRPVVPIYILRKSNHETKLYCLPAITPDSLPEDRYEEALKERLNAIYEPIVSEHVTQWFMLKNTPISVD